MNKIGKWIFSVLLAAMFFALSACGDCHIFLWILNY